MKRAEIVKRIDELQPWYHRIVLPCDDGGDVITPGGLHSVNWEVIREAGAHIDYKGKNVLDMASFDGMWAFEAEAHGAAHVIATDCNWLAFQNFLFCREALRSKVTGLYNVPCDELKKRLDCYLTGHGNNPLPEPVKNRFPNGGDPRFDVVQHLGLLYHLRDPLKSLLQARSVMKDGSKLLIETACDGGTEESVMRFNWGKHGTQFYPDETTWWAPSLSCLANMLRASLFEPHMETVARSMSTKDLIQRIAMVATAVSPDDANPMLVSELRNTYRTPGLEL